MKSLQIVLLAAALALPLANAVGQTSAHEHEATAHGAMELNAGQKWATDAPLRQGMGNMHKAVSSALSAAHSGKMTPAQYDTLASDLNAQVVYVVQNCKLEPKADAQLHILLGDISNGISIVKGEQKGRDRAQGVVRIAQSINDYGKHFDHADLAPIAVGH